MGVSILDAFTLLALPVFADGVTGRLPADEAKPDMPNLEPGVGIRGLFAADEEACATFVATKLVFNGAPGERVAVRTAPGDFDAAAVANFPDAAVGARAIIAPREASAAGDLANAGIDEEGVDLVADLGVRGVEGAPGIGGGLLIGDFEVTPGDLG